MSPFYFPSLFESKDGFTAIKAMHLAERPASNYVNPFQLHNIGTTILHMLLNKKFVSLLEMHTPRLPPPLPF